MIDGTFSELPEAVLRRVRAEGDRGARWLDQLPDLLQQLCDRWSLSPVEVLHGGSESLVVCVRQGDGPLAVLKLLLPGASGPAREILALRIAGGRGYAALLEEAPESNAFLVEHLGPSLASFELSEDEELRVLTETLQRSWMPMDESKGLATAGEKARWLESFIQSNWKAQKRPCSVAVVECALRFTAERTVVASTVDSVLVHGDPHSHNALAVSDGSCGEQTARTFKLVDPDGLFAEPAYDLGVLMREGCETQLSGNTAAKDTVAKDTTAKDTAERCRERCMTLARQADVDARAVWQWGFVERLSTGLELLRLGWTEEGGRMLAVAEACVTLDDQRLV